MIPPGQQGSDEKKEPVIAEAREKLDLHNLPRHVAIIMDGNGRWAVRRGLPRIMGHKRGAETVRKVVGTLPEARRRGPDALMRSPMRMGAPAAGGDLPHEHARRISPARRSRR